MSNKNIVTGQLASITTYDSVTSQVEGVATDSVTANTVSLGTGNLVLSGNLISSIADTITIDPLGDGSPNGNLIVTANMQVVGTLTYNDVVNATTTDLQWIAANDAASTSLASGAGLAVGPAGAYASFTYNSVSNSWQSSLPLVVTGNVTAGYFIGDGSQLTGLPGGYGNSNVAAYLPTYTGNLSAGNVGTTGNIIMNGGKISGFSATVPATLQHYAETAVAGGNLTGTLAVDTTLGTIQRYTLTGNITINGFVNAVAGTNTTLILKQDATGGRTLTSTMKFLGGVKTLSTAANAIDVLSVFYDGVDYLATLGKGYA
jgi:hypothetical protein